MVIRSQSESSSNTHFSFTTISESFRSLANKRVIKPNSSKTEQDEASVEASTIQNDSETNLVSQKPTHKKQPERITLNARGIKYEVLLSVLEKLPKSRLGKLKELLDEIKAKNLIEESDQDNLLELCDGYDLEKNEYYFNRDPYLLNMFLNFYNNDRLHMDDNVCANYFGQELQYWSIDDINIDACCQLKYFDKKDQIQDELKIENKEQNNLINDKKDDFDNTKMIDSIKKKIWNLLERPTSSYFARVSRLYLKLILLSL